MNTPTPAQNTPTVVGIMSPTPVQTLPQTPTEPAITPSPSPYAPGTGEEVGENTPTATAPPPTPTPTPTALPTPPPRWSDATLGGGDPHLDGHFAFEHLGYSLEQVSQQGGALLAVGAPGEAGTQAAHGRVSLFDPVGPGVWGDSPRFTWTSGEEGDGAGRALAAGDMNGDGAVDLLVGAPDAREGAGGVHLLLGVGGPSGGGSLPLAAGGPSLAGAPGSALGLALALGDLNGDGRDDAALGAPGAGEEAAGEILLIWGAPDLQALTPRLRVLGTPGSLTGMALATGDFSGGGLDALAIGAPGAPGYDTEGAGSVALFFGRSQWREAYALEDADLLLMGESPGGIGSGAGQALSLGCDLDGDGRGDLAVGAPSFGVAEGPERGRVYLVRGGGGLMGAAPLSVADARITGELPGDRLGETLACGGDLDGDGAEELLASAPGAFEGKGAVYILWGGKGLFGAAGGPAGRGTTLVGETPFEGLGRALIAPGGGVIAVGAPLADTATGGMRSGRVYIPASSSP